MVCAVMIIHAKPADMFKYPCVGHPPGIQLYSKEPAHHIWVMPKNSVFLPGIKVVRMPSKILTSLILIEVEG